jgi:hypothetical protein
MAKHFKYSCFCSYGVEIDQEMLGSAVKEGCEFSACFMGKIHRFKYSPGVTYFIPFDFMTMDAVSDIYELRIEIDLHHVTRHYIHLAEKKFADQSAAVGIDVGSSALKVCSQKKSEHYHTLPPMVVVWLYDISRSFLMLSGQATKSQEFATVSPGEQLTTRHKHITIKDLYALPPEKSVNVVRPDECMISKMVDSQKKHPDDSVVSGGDTFSYEEEEDNTAIKKAQKAWRKLGNVASCLKKSFGKKDTAPPEEGVRVDILCDRVIVDVLRYNTVFLSILRNLNGVLSSSYVVGGLAHNTYRTCVLNLMNQNLQRKISSSFFLRKVVAIEKFANRQVSQSELTFESFFSAYLAKGYVGTEAFTSEVKGKYTGIQYIAVLNSGFADHKGGLYVIDQGSNLRITPLLEISSPTLSAAEQFGIDFFSVLMGIQLSDCQKAPFNEVTSDFDTIHRYYCSENLPGSPAPFLEVGELAFKEACTNIRLALIRYLKKKDIEEKAFIGKLIPDSSSQDFSGFFSESSFPDQSKIRAFFDRVYEYSLTQKLFSSNVYTDNKIAQQRFFVNFLALCKTKVPENEKILVMPSGGGMYTSGFWEGIRMKSRSDMPDLIFLDNKYVLYNLTELAARGTAVFCDGNSFPDFESNEPFLGLRSNNKQPRTANSSIPFFVASETFISFEKLGLVSLYPLLPIGFYDPDVKLRIELGVPQGGFQVANRIFIWSMIPWPDGTVASPPREGKLMKSGVLHVNTNYYTYDTAENLFLKGTLSVCPTGNANIENHGKIFIEVDFSCGYPDFSVVYAGDNGVETRRLNLTSGLTDVRFFEEG